MKVDRRSFLGLGLGAVAGVAVSPMPWKLIDDVSIWTQNWPWTPVPPGGEVTYDNTVCTLCPGHCGISVRKIDGRPVKIEGRKGYPINNGGVCLHGLSSLQYLYNPARVKQPLIKKGKKWEKLAWQDAITLVSGKLAEIRKKGRQDKLACVVDSDIGTISGLFERFLKAFGSNNFYSMDSMNKTWNMTLKRMHNIDASAGFDIRNSDFVLSFGCGFIEGWGSPVHNFQINSALKDKKAEFVQFEPRLSHTAAKADLWVPVKPGADADLAFGICNYIIANNLYDASYVSGLTKGFSDFSNMLKRDYSPDKVEAMTGVPANKIKEIAIKFAKAKSPIAIAGKGRGYKAGSLKEFSAVHALNCLVGNINKKGGLWAMPFMEYGNWPALNMDSLASQGISRPKIDKAGSADALFAKINASKESPVDVLFVYQSNPCYTLHDVKSVESAVGKIPFVVSFSSFMDETAVKADIILPSSMFLERYEDVPGASGVVETVTGLSKPIVGPVYNTKNPGDSILMIAKAFKGSVASNFPWKDYNECLKKIIGTNWDKLSQEGFIKKDVNLLNVKPEVDFSLFMENMKPVVAEGSEGSFPLILVPVNNMRLFNGAFASAPFTVKTVSDMVIKKHDILVEINPATAKKHGLSQGDYAMIATPKGTAKVRVHVFDGIMPGLIGMDEGLGHSAEDIFIKGKGVNINELIGPVIDAGSGLDAAWGIRAKISRV